MEILVLLLIIVFTVGAASKTSDKLRVKHNVDEVLIYLEKNRNKLVEEQLERYIVLLNDYRNKQSSSKLTAFAWITRVNAKAELESSIIDLKKFYDFVRRQLDDQSI